MQHVTESHVLPEPATKAEAAKLLRVSLRTVNRLMADGTLPYSKIGRSVRIKRSDIAALLESGKALAEGGDAA